jgi:hypothetical protein
MKAGYVRTYKMSKNIITETSKMKLQFTLTASAVKRRLWKVMSYMTALLLSFILFRMNNNLMN